MLIHGSLFYVAAKMSLVNLLHLGYLFFPFLLSLRVSYLVSRIRRAQAYASASNTPILATELEGDRSTMLPS
jgi:hypothetical protein